VRYDRLDGQAFGASAVTHFREELGWVGGDRDGDVVAAQRPPTSRAKAYCPTGADTARRWLKPGEFGEVSRRII